MHCSDYLISYCPEWKRARIVLFPYFGKISQFLFNSSLLTQFHYSQTESREKQFIQTQSQIAGTLFLVIDLLKIQWHVDVCMPVSVHSVTIPHGELTGFSEENILKAAWEYIFLTDTKHKFNNCFKQLTEIQWHI